MIKAEYSIGIKQILFITTTHKQSYETGGKNGSVKPANHHKIEKLLATRHASTPTKYYKILSNLANIKTHDLVPSA